MHFLYFIESKKVKSFLDAEFKGFISEIIKLFLKSTPLNKLFNLSFFFLKKKTWTHSNLIQIYRF